MRHLFSCSFFLKRVSLRLRTQIDISIQRPRAFRSHEQGSQRHGGAEARKSQRRNPTSVRAHRKHGGVTIWHGVGCCAPRCALLYHRPVSSVAAWLTCPGRDGLARPSAGASGACLPLRSASGHLPAALRTLLATRTAAHVYTATGGSEQEEASAQFAVTFRQCYLDPTCHANAAPAAPLGRSEHAGFPFVTSDESDDCYFVLRATIPFLYGLPSVVIQYTCQAAAYPVAITKHHRSFTRN